MTAQRILPLNTDYTDKDFDSLRARLFALINTLFPTWTDQQVANFGNLLVELFAFVGDVLTFYQDNQARESRITTARLRRSLLGLAKLVGYVPKGADAATANVTITLDSPVQAGATLTIPKGDIVKTQAVTDPITYQLLADLVFQAGETTKTGVGVENSTTLTTTVNSNGLANQNFLVPATPYVDKSASPTFANGAYTQVDNFLASQSTDRHFVIIVDQNDRATLVFGNGVNGAIPLGTGTIVYKTGGGFAGRVQAGALNTMGNPTYKDSFGATKTVSVTNPAASSGGDDRETNAQIAVNAPEALRVLLRAVAREDYEIAAQKVPGVARALLVTNNEYAGIPENTGFLFVVPTSGGAPSAPLLASVLAQFVGTGAPFPKTNTFDVQVQGANYLTVNVAAKIFVAQGFTPAQAKANIIAALQSFFAILQPDGTPNPAINFGYYFQDANGIPTGTFDWSTLFDIVREAQGVRKIDAGPVGFLLNGLRADVPFGVIQFPQLGTVTLTDGSTGLLI
jgi:hypothetical protein